MPVYTNTNITLYTPIPLYAYKGGRMREGKDRPGSVLLGARTIQEGGAFLDVTREEVCMWV